MKQIGGNTMQNALRVISHKHKSCLEDYNQWCNPTHHVDDRLSLQIVFCE